MNYLIATMITTDNPLINIWVFGLEITWKYWYIWLVVLVVLIWLIARRFDKEKDDE